MNFSLKLKILLSVTVTCVFAVIVSTFVSVRSGIETLESAILEDTQTLAQVLGHASEGAISFEDVTTVEASLAALKVSPRVFAARVYVDDKPFASYILNESQSRLPSSPNPVGIQTVDGGVVMTEEILSQGNRIGLISMHINFAEVEETIDSMVIDAIWVVLLVSLVSAGIAYMVQAGIVKPVNRIVLALRDISEGEGDLTRRLPEDGRDEVSELARCFNSFIEQLQSIIGNVVTIAGSVDKESSRLVSMSQENECASRAQQTDIQQVVESVNEMSSAIQDVTRSVNEAAVSASEADSAAESGKGIVDGTKQQIQNLSHDIKSSSQVIETLQQETVGIGSVLDVIRGIAEQTNLLALNAAIEAARAGEQGRGFAVVADEVRTLASKTQSSTTEIQEMIERLQAGAHKAVEMMSAGTEAADRTVEKAGQASEALDNITNIVSSIRDRTNQIAATTEQQSAAAMQIDQNVNSVSSVAARTAESSSSMSANSAAVSSSAAEMMELVGRFRI